MGKYFLLLNHLRFQKVKKEKKQRKQGNEW